MDERDQRRLFEQLLAYGGISYSPVLDAVLRQVGKAHFSGENGGRVSSKVIADELFPHATVDDLFGRYEPQIRQAISRLRKRLRQYFEVEPKGLHQAMWSKSAEIRTEDIVSISLSVRKLKSHRPSKCFFVIRRVIRNGSVIFIGD